MSESISTPGQGPVAERASAAVSSIPVQPSSDAAEDGRGIVIHDLESEVLADPDAFDRAWMLGTWNVAWSTLPMWKVGPAPDRVRRSSVGGAATLNSELTAVQAG